MISLDNDPTPLNAEHQAGKLWMPIFTVFWYVSTRGLNPRSTTFKADAPTTTPLRRFQNKFEISDTNLI